MTKKAKGAKKPGTILINFVLDKSGSMDIVRAATIDGFNEFLGEQARQPGEALLTLTMFDTQFVHVCEGVPLREVPRMTEQEFDPDGMTALYDAVAHSIRSADDYLAKLPKKPDQILFVVMTDGEENSSREFDRDKVFAMIADRQAQGYEFIYLGANQDSYAVSQSIGMRKGRSRNWEHSDKGQRASMVCLSESVSNYRMKAEPTMSGDWFPEEDESSGDQKSAS
jgi:hypothetical protein